ncbi:MAG: hypothetical protein ACYTHN_02960, partial [Planctomycetota bacterium]
LRAKSPEGKEFGPESVGGLLLTAKTTGPGSVASRLSQGVVKHMGETTPGPLAVVVLKRKT